MESELFFQAPGHNGTERNVVKLEHGQNVAKEFNSLPVSHECVRIVY